MAPIQADSQRLRLVELTELDDGESVGSAVKMSEAAGGKGGEVGSEFVELGWLMVGSGGSWEAVDTDTLPGRG